MKLKKIALVALAGLAVITLVACSDSGKDEDIITMKGDTIRVSDLYKEAKAYPTAGTTTLLQNMTFKKIFEKSFGKKVSDKDVNKDFEAQKASLGDNFASALQQAGYTEKTYKETLRSQLLLKKAIKADIKYTNDAYKTAFETYHPTVEAYVISKQTEDEAKTAITEAIKSPEDFDKTAKENKNNVKFDSVDTQVPSEVKEAAFKLKDGEITDKPIVVSDSQAGTTYYYLVKMIKNADKGTDWKKYKKELTADITSTKENDTDFVNGVIAKYLTKYNVKVKPSEFATIFEVYEAAVTSSSSKSSETSTESSSTEAK